MNVPGTGMMLERSAEGLVLLGVVLQMAEAFEMSRYTVIRIRASRNMAWMILSIWTRGFDDCKRVVSSQQGSRS